MNKIIFTLIAFIITIQLFSISSAQTKTKSSSPSFLGQATGTNNTQPFHLRHADQAKWVKLKNNSDMAVMWGNVEIYLPKEQVTLSADSVQYKSNPRFYSAYGRVKITKVDPKEGTVITTSRKATYEPSKSKIILEGTPKVVRDKDEVTGDVMTVIFNNAGTVIEGTNVKGILFPRNESVIETQSNDTTIIQID